MFALCTTNVPENLCSPGSGGKSSDCVAEWLMTPQPAVDRHGIPKNRTVCMEGDPSCDYDSEAEVCTFHLSMCMNNTDPRIPVCLPSSWVEYLEVRSPRPGSLNPIDVANRAALERFASCNAGGLCIPLVRSGAIVPSVTGTIAWNPARDLCSDTVEIRVPLRKRSTGALLKARRSISVRVKGARLDTDRLQFQCLPGTCGNGVIEPEREQCDDSNRLAGDGCDPSCRIEPATPTASETPPATLTPLPSFTPTQSPLPSPTITPTISPTRTRTSTAVPTASASPTTTWTPSATPTSSPSLTPIPTQTSTRTVQPTPSRTPSFSPTSTAQPSLTPTPSSSPTLTAPPSLTPTLSPPPTATSTPPPTQTFTHTATPPLPTATPTPSSTPVTPQPCNPDSESYSEPAFYRSLAYRWAPLIMQDTASKWNADFIGKINYDNDWRSNNNWDNLPSAGIAPYLYYDVLETSTHWFIHYHTYHPRDWDNVFFGTCAPVGSDCHENDTENLMVMVQKDGSTYGRFRLLETRAHNDFYQYALPNDGVGNGSGSSAEDIDNDPERGFSLFTDTSVGVTDPRPAIYVESKGHGMCDWWDNNGPFCSHSDDTVPGGDGVMYYPNQNVTPSVPANPSGGQWYNFKSPYNLISIWDDAWVLRSCLGNNLTFDNPITYPGVSGNGSVYIGQAMDGDDYTADAGTAWWAQSDGSNNLEAGVWTFDPAATVLRQLVFSETVDTTYLYNPFLGIQ